MKAISTAHNHQPRYRLSHRLLVYILICSSIFTMIATAFQLYFEYKSELEDIHANISIIETSYLEAFATSVYNVDTNQLKNLLLGVSRIKDIEYVELETKSIPENFKTFFGDPKSSKDIVRKFPLAIKNTLNQSIKVGTLIIVADLKGVYDRLFKRAIIVVFSNAAKTFPSSICILLIIQWLITSHLHVMARHTDQINFDKMDEPLILNRRKLFSKKIDEIDIVVNSFNAMRVRLKNDISNRQKAEQKLKEAVNIINRSPAVVFLWKNEEGWPVEFVSENVQELMGYHAEDFLNEGLQYHQIVHPDDLDNIVTGVNFNNRKNDTEVYSSPPYRIITKNGEVKWIDDRIFVRRDENLKITHLQGIVLDMTHQKKAEDQLYENDKQYQSTLNSMNDGIFVVDKNLQTIIYNRAFQEFINPFEANAVLDNSHLSTVLPFFSGKVAEEFDSVFKTAKSFLGEKNVKLNDKSLMIEYRIIPIEKKGKVSRAIAVIRDITKQKLTAELMVQNEKMKSLGEISAGIAHEINNPNNFILLNTSFLSEAWSGIESILDQYHAETGDFVIGGISYSELRDSVPKLFMGILEGGERIKQIVHELKEYAYPEPNTNRSFLSPKTILESAITLLSNLIKRSTNSFNIKYEDDLPLIWGNFQRLEQVMINLIQNACEALEISKKKIDITVTYEKESNKIVIKIKDEGKGISEKDIKRIKDPFFTTKRGKGGTGLGLFVSDGIIDEHHGKLEFSSTIGKGTTASISLAIDKT